MATQTTNVPGSSYDNVYLNSLIWGCGWTDIVTPIRYWFDSGLNVLPRGLPSGLSSPAFIGEAWTDPEKSAFVAVTKQYEAVCNLKFLPAESAADADIVWWKAPGSVMVDSKGGTVLGAHEVPDASNPKINGYFNYEDPSWQYLEKGQSGYTTVLHELGHAMGLAHPFDGGTEADATTFPGVKLGNSSSMGKNDLNQGIWTVMSYNPGWNKEQPHQTYGQEGSLMAFDIAALQKLYGGNTTDIGNNTYYLPNTLGRGTYWESIWDAGGFDYISNEGSSHACTINLNAAPLTGADAAGYVSYIRGIPGGFTIANGVDIEFATGGLDNDVLIGNDSSNQLNGGPGADTMSGGAGNDTYYVDNVRDKINESSNGGIDTVWSSISLTLTSQVENLLLLDQAGDAHITGNVFNNYLSGNLGNNTLSGQSGNDTLIGLAGADTLTGGEGADYFIYYFAAETGVGASSRDVITDFSPSQGDLIYLSPLDAVVGTADNESFAYIGAAAFSAAGQLRFEKGILAGETTGDGVADFEIQLSGVRSFDVTGVVL